MKIAVIYGGDSTEREISIKSKNAICQALKELDQDYQPIELTKNIAADLQNGQIDLVFNACHGSYGEDGRLSALLDILQIPYTHSAAKACQLAMDKFLAKNLATQLNIKTAPAYLVKDLKDFANLPADFALEPFVLKPVAQGSSVGVQIIQDPLNFMIMAEHFDYGPLLVERYLKAQEVHVAIVDNKAIGAVEIIPEQEFYDYDAKYNSKTTRYIIPPEISKKLQDKALKAAEQLHNYLGCNYISRVDFLCQNDELYFLEINTHPGFTKTSLVPKVAAAQNISFNQIIAGLIAAARYEAN